MTKVKEVSASTPVDQKADSSKPAKKKTDKNKTELRGQCKSGRPWKTPKQK